MGKHCYLIEAGHGGFHLGKYMTDPKWGKFFEHSEKYTAYEGATNRSIARRLFTKLTDARIDWEQIHHDYLDIGLKAVVDKVKAIHQQKRNCIFLSIHSDSINSTTKKTDTYVRAYGCKVFVSEKSSQKSKEFATAIAQNFRTEITEWPLNQPKPDQIFWIKNYYVLKNTPCPAALPELLFFDEIKQAEFLESEQGQERLANVLFRAIMEMES